MAFITPTGTHCRVRTAPTVFSLVKGHLEYGKIYQATLTGEWYSIPSLEGYSHQSVVRTVPDPAIPRPAAIPIYTSQWAPEANGRRNDCGPTCLRMILRARGDTTPVNQLQTKDSTGITDAPELRDILAAHNVVSYVDRADPNLPLEQAAPPFSIILIKYEYLPRNLVWDKAFTGWHWLIFLGLDKTDPNWCFVHDPDYGGDRIAEGNRKRYPTAALRAAFRPYGNNTKTTALVIPDLIPLAGPEPTWQRYFVDSPFPLGINLRSGPAITTPSIGNGYANGAAVDIDLASLSGGYVREQRGGWLAMQYLAKQPPAQPNPEPQPEPDYVRYPVNTIKVGWHIQYDTDSYKIILPHAARMVGKYAGFVVVGMPDVANALLDMGYYVMYRDYFPADQTFKTDWLNGKTEAECIQMGRDFYYGAHYTNTQKLKRSPKLFIKLTNEVGYHAMDYAFALGYMYAADDDNGRHVALWGDSYGTPETREFKTRIPALRHARRKGHVLTMNFYGRCQPQPNGDCVPADFPVSDQEHILDFGLRYIQFYDAVPPDCRPYIINGETGASNSMINHGFAVNDSIAYSDIQAASKYGELVLFNAYYTLNKWADNNLIYTLPEMEQKLANKPNPPMSGPVTQPGPVPDPDPVPNPPPGWRFPFPANVRGIHGNAGGWQPNAAELDKIRQNKIELLFLVTYEQNQALLTVNHMRNAGVKHFVLRATHRGGWAWQDFANGSLPRLKEYAAVLGGSQNLAIQIHNEVNLVAEGWLAGWSNGLTFSDWFLRLADFYRRELPGCKLGFPALSPGVSVPGIRLDEITFAKQARTAIAAADWVGVHYYWEQPDGADIKPPFATWAALYPGKPLLGTEVGPAERTPATAQALRKAYATFASGGVPMCAWLLNSPTNDFALASWVRQGIVL